MDTVDIIGLLVPVTYFVFLVTEKLWPAREFPPRKGWQWIGVGFLVLIIDDLDRRAAAHPGAVDRGAPVDRRDAGSASSAERSSGSW